MKGTPMSPDDKLKSLRSFLARAAYDDDFRNHLQNDTPDDVRSLLEKRCEIVVDDHAIAIPEKRTIPPKDVCKELLAWTCSLEEYSQVAVIDPLFAPIFVVVGHAMPLVITAQDAVGASR